MVSSSYPRIASFPDAAALAGRLHHLGQDLPFDDVILTAPVSPLAQPLEIPWQGGTRRLGNRLTVQPMEGWDGEPDGRPSELTRRRWLRFGLSGAKLIWGGEAVAVLPEARANPDQLLLNETTASSLEAMRREMVEAHRRRFGQCNDLLVGLQLTHSGRFSRPHEKGRLEPVLVYHHPILDSRFPPAERCPPVSDCEVSRIVEAFGRAARLAREIGFDFVDLKHCHGYLGHEFLSAFTRPGQYGGSLENRTRFLRELIGAVRNSAPGLEIGVRLSAYDSIPFATDPQTGRGVPVACPTGDLYRYGFGVDPRRPHEPDLSETRQVLAMLRRLGVLLLNLSAGSPYYSAHLQRPALFPPCDAYRPPEDPIAGAARLQTITRQLKMESPDLVIVSSGWSYFQNYLPHFAQALVREGWTDSVGLGRMMLAYPELPADVLEKGQLDQKYICRTFSDCTNGPRQGMVSGCFPLDPFYRARPEAGALAKLRASMAREESKREASTGQVPDKN